MTTNTENIQGQNLTNRKHEPLTHGIVNCRVSEGFNVSASIKLWYNLTGNRFEIGN